MTITGLAVGGSELSRWRARSTSELVTGVMAVVVGLSFVFGFGNVLALALRLGVTVWVAPLVAPAVDLTVVGLLVAIRRLAVAGVAPERIRAARRLLVLASMATLLLNIAEPLILGQYAKAAFDAVGPLLLIGWAEVGPDLLEALDSLERQEQASPTEEAERPPRRGSVPTAARAVRRSKWTGAELLELARQEDARHRELHGRPIAADTLRKRLEIGAERARRLVHLLRQPLATD
ncbi:hypothetical protein NLX83_15445 [Allokutzneria sp. A3M-2-11 16]|uniref:hypothetical protein n=1 Tax=Allokutzneria sp. A3M-2-11 16 TaxID=2962043 RepID=UPI0020B6C0EF|nr:hypothetical protein [Allokutzneria sp. A3M-2-11 16]MCP3800661.1 hypothetical protein [Allokutzneria sp. A3M-2-11 16]